MSGPVLEYRSRERRRVLPLIFWLICALVLATLAISLWKFVSTGRRGDGSPRLRCASNLVQVGQAILLYANDYHDQMPPDFAVLPSTEDIWTDVFTCPATDDVKTSATQPAAIRADFAAGGHCSYVYVDGYATYSTLAPTDVVAFEPLANHGDGANALFGDGHVEFVNKAAAAAIERQFKAGTRPVRVPAETP